jgi:AcrR family transcriptional regulator
MTVWPETAIRTKSGRLSLTAGPGCDCSESEEAMKRQDRRIQRTQQLLEAALLSLIKEKEFDAISVQEIIDRANVGRATFYTHYDNKEDLLESGFDALLAALRERQREARSHGGQLMRGCSRLAVIC